MTDGQRNNDGHRNNNDGQRNNNDGQRNNNDGQRPNQPRANKRRGQKPRPKRVELWRPVPKLAAPEPIAPATDPTAVLRSLGDLPLPGQVAVAEHYVAAVVERAAGLATALAATAGLLAGPDDDADQGG